ELQVFHALIEALDLSQPFVEGARRLHRLLVGGRVLRLERTRLLIELYEPLRDLLEPLAGFIVGTDRGFFRGEPVPGSREEVLCLGEQLIVRSAFLSGEKR